MIVSSVFDHFSSVSPLTSGLVFALLSFLFLSGSTEAEKDALLVFEVEKDVLHEFVTLTTSDVSDVDLLLFETGSLTDVTWSVVGDAVAPAHGIVVVAVTNDVAHAAGHTEINSLFIL